jgi:hypothetical protein
MREVSVVIRSERVVEVCGQASLEEVIVEEVVPERAC